MWSLIYWIDHNNYSVESSSKFDPPPKKNQVRLAKYGNEEYRGKVLLTDGKKQTF